VAVPVQRLYSVICQRVMVGGEVPPRRRTHDLLVGLMSRSCGGVSCLITWSTPASVSWRASFPMAGLGASGCGMPSLFDVR
jgi:hypothetical protein